MTAHITIPHDTARQRAAARPASILSQPKLYDSRHFDYLNQSWLLFKRSHGAKAKWYFKCHVGNVRERKSLGTANWALAVTEAKLIIDALLHARMTGRRDALDVALGRAKKTNAVPDTSTFAELFAVVERLDMLADSRSRSTYVWGARKFLAFSLGCSEADAGVQPLGILDGAFGTAAFARAIAHAATLPDQAAQIKFRRQFQGWFANLKALFAPDAVRSMPALGITPPPLEALEAFRKSKPKRFKVSKAAEFIAPSPAVLRETFRQWIKLGAIRRHPVYYVRGGSANSKKRNALQPLHETARRNMFIAIGYMLACGLRKAEAAQIRERHVTRDGHGVPRLVADGIKVKNKTGKLEVKPLNPFWHILQKTIDRNGWRFSPDGPPSPDDYVLTERAQVDGHSARSPGLVFKRGGPCDRTYWPFYHIGKWLRDLGWRLQKTNHALRDAAASYVTMKFGLDRAKIFCRHATRATTESHYSGFVDEDLMDNPKRLAWLSWAK